MASSFRSKNPNIILSFFYYTPPLNSPLGKEDGLIEINSGSDYFISSLVQSQAFTIVSVKTTVMSYSKDNCQHIIRIVIKAKPVLSPIIATLKAPKDKLLKV